MWLTQMAIIFYILLPAMEKKIKPYTNLGVFCLKTQIEMTEEIPRPLTPQSSEG
jgi:hypothetical protein